MSGTALGVNYLKLESYARFRPEGGESVTVLAADLWITCLGDSPQLQARLARAVCMFVTQSSTLERWYMALRQRWICG